VAQQCPRLEHRVDLRSDSGRTDVPRRVNRPRKQRVEVVAHPVRVQTRRRCGQVIGAGQRRRRIARIQNIVAQPHPKSSHGWHGRRTSADPARVQRRRRVPCRGVRRVIQGVPSRCQMLLRGLRRTDRGGLLRAGDSPCHQVTVGVTGGGEFVVAVLEVVAAGGELLFEFGDAFPQGAGFIDAGQAGVVKDLFAEELRTTARSAWRSGGAGVRCVRAGWPAPPARPGTAGVAPQRSAVRRTRRTTAHPRHPAIPAAPGVSAHRPTRQPPTRRPGAQPAAHVRHRTGQIRCQRVTP
jgi:hypothetical protein